MFVFICFCLNWHYNFPKSSQSVNQMSLVCQSWLFLHLICHFHLRIGFQKLLKRCTLQPEFVLWLSHVSFNMFFMSWNQVIITNSILYLKVEVDCMMSHRFFVGSVFLAATEKSLLFTRVWELLKVVGGQPWISLLNATDSVLNVGDQESVGGLTVPSM